MSYVRPYMIYAYLYCFADCLHPRDGLHPSKEAEPDIWLHCNKDKYEYIAVYVDDLAIAAKDHKQVIEVLMEKYKFKPKELVL